MARWYGAALTSGETVQDVKEWPARIRLVTADAVREAARKWLDKRRSVTGYLVKELPSSQEHSP
jgi:zinc protease